MAKIDVDDYMFECAICIEQIDNTWRMLPCQHTFCLRCLEKLYAISREPQCPTCRKVIMVSMDGLEKPRLLFTLFEKYKASQNEETDIEKEDLSAAIERSVDDYHKKQEIEQEEQYLQIALCTSADQAAIEAEKESLLYTKDKNDLTAVIELSIQEHNERELNLSKVEELELQTALLSSERELLLASEKQLKKQIAIMQSSSFKSDEANGSYSDTIVNLPAMMGTFCITGDKCPSSAIEVVEGNNVIPVEACSSVSVINLSTDIPSEKRDLLAGSSTTDENIEDVLQMREICVETLVKNSEGCLYIPNSLDTLDLSHYLRIKHRKPVLDAIIMESMDQGKMNLLKKNEIRWYLETVDDYLDALKYYRRDQMNKMVEDCIEDRESMEHILASEGWDDNCNNSDTAFHDSTEDSDLDLAMKLSRQMYIQRDEESLLNIMLKKSEMLDPIDLIRTRLLNVKEKLEFRLVIIESEECN